MLACYIIIVRPYVCHARGIAHMAIQTSFPN